MIDIVKELLKSVRLERWIVNASDDELNSAYDHDLKNIIWPEWKKGGGREQTDKMKMIVREQEKRSRKAVLDSRKE